MSPTSESECIVYALIYSRSIIVNNVLYVRMCCHSVIFCQFNSHKICINGHLSNLTVIIIIITLC